jgi:hypothetical protein
VPRFLIVRLILLGTVAFGFGGLPEPAHADCNASRNCGACNSGSYQIQCQCQEISGSQFTRSNCSCTSGSGCQDCLKCTWTECRAQGGGSWQCATGGTGSRCNGGCSNWEIYGQQQCGLSSMLPSFPKDAFTQSAGVSTNETPCSSGPVQILRVGYRPLKPVLLLASAGATPLFQSTGLPASVPFVRVGMPDVDFGVVDATPVFRPDGSLTGLNYTIENGDTRGVRNYVLQFALYWSFRPEPVLITHVLNAPLLAESFVEPVHRGFASAGVSAPGAELLKIEARVDSVEFLDGSSSGPNELGFRDRLRDARSISDRLLREVAERLRRGESFEAILARERQQQGKAPSSSDAAVRRDVFAILTALHELEGAPTFNQRVFAAADLARGRN